MIMRRTTSTTEKQMIMMTSGPVEGMMEGEVRLIMPISRSVFHDLLSTGYDYD